MNAVGCILSRGESEMKNLESNHYYNENFTNINGYRIINNRKAPTLSL